MGLTAASYGKMAALYPSAGSYLRAAEPLPAPRLSDRMGVFLDYLLVRSARSMARSPSPSWSPGYRTGRGCCSRPRYAIISAASLHRANQSRPHDRDDGGDFGVHRPRDSHAHCRGRLARCLTTPFYDPATFNFQTILTATSVAALTTAVRRCHYPCRGSENPRTY